VFICFAIALFYTVILRYCAGAIVWGALLCIMGLLLSLGMMFYQRSTTAVSIDEAESMYDS
jgi:hypothetical protein